MGYAYKLKERIGPTYDKPINWETYVFKKRSKPRNGRSQNRA
jgi:hypothetical protein